MGFCQSGSQSVHPLTTLLLASNKLSGDVNLTLCGNLVNVDVGVSGDSFYYPTDYAE